MDKEKKDIPPPKKEEVTKSKQTKRGWEKATAKSKE